VEGEKEPLSSDVMVAGKGASISEERMANGKPRVFTGRPGERSRTSYTRLGKYKARDRWYPMNG
jgi:hypothetical protein